jgi:WD repeat-containing protein 7
LYVVPGAAAPLIEVCFGGDNLMLIYADRRARLWDVKTREFWRSMKMDKGQELLDQGGWMRL